MNRSRISGFLCLACLLAVLPRAGAQSLPADVTTQYAVPATLFSSWFAGGKPAPNGLALPADSLGFSPETNSNFYRWSWQMFLWLTSPDPSAKDPRDHIFDSRAFFDVSSPDAQGNRTLIPHTPGSMRLLNVRAAQKGPHGLPVVMDKNGDLFEVETAPTGAKAALEEGAQPLLMDPKGKKIRKPKFAHKDHQNMLQLFMTDDGKPVYVDALGKVVDVEEGQAGGGAVLLSQKGAVIYYSIMVNDVYAYFLTMNKNSPAPGQATRFPITGAEQARVIAYAQSRGVTFPDPNALALELKASWVEASTLADASPYVKTRAQVPVYRQQRGKWTLTGESRPATLALVGLHVVGSVNKHSEMIWATFEHFGNTPEDDYSYINTRGQAATVGSSTAGDWLFCKSGSTGVFNFARQKFVPPDVIQATLLAGDISPSDTIRRKAWGGAFDVPPNNQTQGGPSVAVSNSEVISLNQSVNRLLPGDIRTRGYFLVGATWTFGGAFPTGPFNPRLMGNEIGTSQLANSTMETYQQGTSKLWSTRANCFACHNPGTAPTRKMLDVSHIYDDILPLSSLVDSKP